MKTVSFIILSAAFLITAAAHGQNSRNITGFYSGPLGKNLRVTLSLKENNGMVSGYYHYNKAKTDIMLRGDAEKNGNFKLKEYGEFLHVTGLWTGKANGGNSLSGTWTSPDSHRSMKFTLSRILLKGVPGRPMNKKVVFTEIEVKLPSITAAVPEAVAESLFKQLLSDGTIDTTIGYFKKAFETGKHNPAALFSAVAVDLNNDGTPELIVGQNPDNAFCGSQNCPVWILKKTKSGYKQMLYSAAGVYGYKTLEHTIEGYHDIVLQQHSSAAEQNYYIYGFRDGVYKQINCVGVTALENDKGIVRYSSHPCD